VVAVVALLAAVYVIHSLLSLPGRAVDAGREVAKDLRSLAASFRQGSVETAFVGYATRLSGSNKLQVAELRQVETYTRTESSSLLWGTLQLPDVVVEARVPVEYVYTLDLAETWLFELEGSRLRVTAPALEFNAPALDVSRLEYDVRASSILRNEDAAIVALQSGLTQLSRERARQQIGLVRETARRQTEEFVGNWLGSAFDGGEDCTVDVIFEDEPVPGEGATLGKGLDGTG
jgi:hypothetical protein